MKITNDQKAYNERSSRTQSDTSNVFPNLEVEMLTDGNNANDFTIVTNNHKCTHQSLFSSSSREVTKRNKQIFTSNNRYSVMDAYDNN